METARRLSVFMCACATSYGPTGSPPPHAGTSTQSVHLISRAIVASFGPVCLEAPRVFRVPLGAAWRRWDVVDDVVRAGSVTTGEGDIGGACSGCSEWSPLSPVPVA